jgi:hypothetical protein
VILQTGGVCDATPLPACTNGSDLADRRSM